MTSGIKMRLSWQVYHKLLPWQVIETRFFQAFAHMAHQDLLWLLWLLPHAGFKIMGLHGCPELVVLWIKGDN
jgi:hypothetical protein